MVRLLVVLLLASTPARAATDYCASGHSTAILLVDRTTQFDKTDRAIFLDAVGALISRLGGGDRLVGFTISGDYTDSQKFFDQCKPGCPDDGFFANLFSTCSPLAARAQARAYQTELAGALATLLREPQETKYSDIFRTVAEVTRAYSAAAAGKPLAQLIMFSDLLENSTFLAERDLRRLPSAEVGRLLTGAQLRANVAGTSVRVFGFGRDDAPGRPALPQEQRKSVQAIWEKWFRDGGAREVEVGFR